MGAKTRHNRSMNDTLAMIMAGGKGSRLAPITSHRAKPAVPFGGRYRIIDFALSNFVNSGYRRIFVLTQYMAHSLIQHLNRNWHVFGPGEFIEVAPAQMRLGEHWYRGTADSVLHGLCDFRLPLWMTPEDCGVVAAVLSEAMTEVVEGR